VDDRRVGVRVSVGQRRWGPPNLLQNGCRGNFPGVKWPRHEANYSAPASRGQEYVDLFIHSPIRLYGVVLNYLSIGVPLGARGSVVG
jgi:hypothetical protein